MDAKRTTKRARTGKCTLYDHFYGPSHPSLLENFACSFNGTVYMHIACSYFSAYFTNMRQHRVATVSLEAISKFTAPMAAGGIGGRKGERGHIATRTPHGCAINLPSLDVARSLRGEPLVPEVQPFSYAAQREALDCFLVRTTDFRHTIFQFSTRPRLNRGLAQRRNVFRVT